MFSLSSRIKHCLGTGYNCRSMFSRSCGRGRPVSVLSSCPKIHYAVTRLKCHDVYNLTQQRTCLSYEFRPKRYFHITSYLAEQSGLDKPLSSEAEKVLALRKKKDAKRQERLDRQRARLDLKSIHQQQSNFVYSSPTADGDKKDISSLPDSYSPRYVEAAWYSWWEKQGFFLPEYQQKQFPASDGQLREKFVICLPPPNVTGYLHLGHALGNAIEDALVRWHRMCGRLTLWNPGVDHAGIATQIAVEKKLYHDHKLTRHDIGRERFVDETYKWKDEKVSKIYEQMKRMGSSLDWSRACFTLDPKLNRAVTTAFIQLFDSGDIYRSKRLVNWSCSLCSAISDIEVEDLPVTGKTYLDVPGYSEQIPFGVMTHFAYPVEGLDTEIVVATTRLETMLGDVAVAVHPDDPRYTHLHNRFVRHPLCHSRLLPIVTDASIDVNFGTGAMKVTPGHDRADFDLSKCHNLPIINIMDDNGKLINVPSPFHGMKRFDARKMVQSSLEILGLIRGETDHNMVIPICSRSNDVIEYLLKDQWFVSCQQMAAKAIKAVTSGSLKLIPNHYEKQWVDWLESTCDWCISRQLWWGHRIPAFRIISADNENANGAEQWIAAASYDEALQKAAARLQIPIEKIHLKQDEDVLDTWFSSALFPFSIFGWPEKTEDLAKFYPTSLLETASDIMFFWVARMVMLGERLTGQLPFREVLFHSIIRDSHGRKMSKSLGNVIDPMDVINGIGIEELTAKLDKSNLPLSEISKAKAGLLRDMPLGIEQSGADALRFTLCNYNFTGHVINVDVSHVKANRHFCNKIWQAFRFFLMNVDVNFKPLDVNKLYGSASATDKWMLSRLSAAVEVCEQGFSSYNLTQVTHSLHSYWWAELCGVYLEYVKAVIQSKPSHEVLVSKSILHACMDVGLRLLSPFMPFITEELYQRLPGTHVAPSVMVAPYPQPNQFNFRDAAIEDDVTEVRDMVNQILSLRKFLNLTKAKADLYVQTKSNATSRAINQHELLLTVLSRSNRLFVNGTVPHLGDCIDINCTNCTLHVDVKGLIDEQQVVQRLTQQKCNMEQELKKLQLNQTATSTPSDVLLTNQEKIAALQSTISRVSGVISSVTKLRTSSS